MFGFKESRTETGGAILETALLASLVALVCMMAVTVAGQEAEESIETAGQAIHGCSVNGAMVQGADPACDGYAGKFNGGGHGEK